MPSCSPRRLSQLSVTSVLPKALHPRVSPTLRRLVGSHSEEFHLVLFRTHNWLHKADTNNPLTF